MAAFDVAVCVDEAGLQGKPKVCILAGYIAGIPRWQKFERAWNKVLKRNDVREFHSKAYFAQDPQGQRVGKYVSLSNPTVKGSYGDWRLRKYDDFLSDLLEIIENHPIKPLGGGVEVENFMSFTYGERKWLTGGHMRADGRWLTTGAPSRPYHLLFDHILAAAADQTERGKKILYVFDSHKQYEGRAIQQFTESAWAVKRDMREKFGGIVFAERHQAPGLQAADLYVHCSHRYSVEPASVTGARKRALRTIAAKGALYGEYTKGHMEHLFRNVPPNVRELMRATQDPNAKLKA